MEGERRATGRKPNERQEGNTQVRMGTDTSKVTMDSLIWSESHEEKVEVAMGRRRW